MFQIQIDAHLYNTVIAQDPEYQQKLEPCAIHVAHILAKKLVVVTFSEESVSERSVIRFLKRFAPIYERKGASAKDPVHGGRYRKPELEKHQAIKDPRSPERTTLE